MASDYKFVLDSGPIVYVCAECRKAAFEEFCKEHGVSEEWVKAHCAVRNLGRVK